MDEEGELGIQVNRVGGFFYFLEENILFYFLLIYLGMFIYWLIFRLYRLMVSFSD